METEDLKNQFQELQAQQQKKLLERRRKKEQANKNENQSREKSAGKFGVNDDLNLKLSEPPSKGFSYLSEELVEHLNDQIRAMKDENGRLYKLLSERDFEIRQLKKKAEDYKTSLPQDSVTNETAATKIIELSKKVRELTSEKESEKTKCRQLQRKIQELQSQPLPSEAPSTMGSMISLRSQVSDSQSENPSAADMKALQDRLKQAEAKVTDFRNQCLSLRQELKVANKVLSQEIGENVNMQSLLNETSNWRGRAQQIIALQQKVDELKVQLESQTDGMDSTMGPNEKGKNRQEKRYREELKRLDRERKEAQELISEVFDSNNAVIVSKIQSSLFVIFAFMSHLFGAKQAGGLRRKDLPKESEHEEAADSIEKDELLTKLEIQLDEINALKAALQRTIKAKDEDMKVYSSTLDQTKQVFLQALRQMKDKQLSDQGL
ncbi:coiled-coil domain-containing protein 13 [Plakobranchus ocellatus]|uniref:Coiled-coil domain-containing protein 13 n=1 Tax=Plakobranchus ocellatus TaxID=259542 RepID=A0AAV4CFS1_9GAST|nr:coiled-coil domain-containing protein 13 [Plakobranchus ocellatus]